MRRAAAVFALVACGGEPQNIAVPQPSATASATPPVSPKPDAFAALIRNCKVEALAPLAIGSDTVIYLARSESHDDHVTIHANAARYANGVVTNGVVPPFDLPYPEVEPGETKGASWADMSFVVAFEGAPNLETPTGSIDGKNEIITHGSDGWHVREVPVHIGDANVTPPPSPRANRFEKTTRALEKKFRGCRYTGDPIAEADWTTGKLEQLSGKNQPKCATQTVALHDDGKTVEHIEVPTAPIEMVSFRFDGDRALGFFRDNVGHYVRAFTFSRGKQADFALPADTIERIIFRKDDTWLFGRARTWRGTTTFTAFGPPGPWWTNDGEGTEDLVVTSKPHAWLWKKADDTFEPLPDGIDESCTPLDASRWIFCIGEKQNDSAYERASGWKRIPSESRGASVHVVRGELWLSTSDERRSLYVRSPPHELRCAESGAPELSQGLNE